MVKKIKNGLYKTTKKIEHITIETVCFYKNGKKHGIQSEISSDGSRSYELYINGMKEGVHKFYEYGNLVMEIPYSKNKRNGILRIYDDEHLCKEMTCKNGRISGLIRYFDENGIITEETTAQKERKKRKEMKKAAKKEMSLSFLGAIVGDIVGSRFEWDNIKSKKFNFFHSDCFFTDDTVMTIAVGNALVECKGNYENLSQQTIKSMKEIGLCYPDCGYGLKFEKWLHAPNPTPYNSWGNGAAMRVSACAYFAKNMEDVKNLVHKVTAISHNHPEGLKGGEATAVAIYMALLGASKEGIENIINKNYYPMDFTLDKIRSRYKFYESCQQTVPQALKAFFESESFEDAIRNAISLGGDSDTIAAITGAVAGAYYGIPLYIHEEVAGYLDDRLKKLIKKIIDGIRES